MRHKLLVSGVLVAGFVTAVPMAPTMMLEGNVVSVNLEANLFKMHAMDPLTGEKRNLDIVVTSNTAFDGIDSILELKIGDDVSVEAKHAQDERTWNADSVDVPLSEISDEDPMPFGGEEE